MVTIDGSGLIQLWNRDGSVAPLRAFLAGGKSIAYDADNGFIAIADELNRITVWEVLTGELRERGTINDAGEAGPQITALAVGAGGAVAAASADSSVAVWDLSSKARKSRFKAGDTAIHALAFDRNAKRLATADWAGKVNVWGRIDTPSPTKGALKVGGNQDDLPAAYSVAFDTGGTRLAVGAHDGSVLLWDLSSSLDMEPARLRGVGGHSPGPIYAVAFGEDGTTLASADGAGVVIVWDANAVLPGANGRPLSIRRRIAGLGESIRALAMDRNDVVAAGGQTVLLMDISGAKSALGVSLPGACAGDGTTAGKRAGRWGAIAYAPLTSRVFAACNGKVREWDLSLGLSASVERETGIVHPLLNRLVVDAKGLVVVTAVSKRRSMLGSVTAWRRVDSGGSQFLKVRGEVPVDTALDLERNGRWLATAAGGELHLLDLEAVHLSPRSVPIGPGSSYRAIAFSPTSNLLAGGGGDPVPKIWRLEAGGLSPVSDADVARAPGDDRARLAKLGWEPGGDVLYSSDDNGQVCAWDPRSAGQKSLRTHGTPRVGVLVSRSGLRARAYDVDAGGRVLVQFAFGTSELGTTAIWSPDGKHVDERVIATLVDDGKGHQIAAEPSGDRVIVTGDQLTVWDLGPEALRKAARGIANASAVMVSEP
jgi:WD40 repeat protein